MERHSIEPENTRVTKVGNGLNAVPQILQASAENSTNTAELGGKEIDGRVVLEGGDHAAEMIKIYIALKEALLYTSSAKQTVSLNAYIESFNTGNLEAYRKSQEIWVTDISPGVETTRFRRALPRSMWCQS